MNKGHLRSRLGCRVAPSKLPLVEITGCGRVLIENHAGVLSYSQEEIIVRLSYGCIRITGQDMKLAEMHREQLVISGQIDGAFLHRR